MNGSHAKWTTSKRHVSLSTLFLNQQENLFVFFVHCLQDILSNGHMKLVCTRLNLNSETIAILAATPFGFDWAFQMLFSLSHKLLTWTQFHSFDDKSNQKRRGPHRPKSCCVTSTATTQIAVGIYVPDSVEKKKNLLYTLKRLVHTSDDDQVMFFLYSSII